MAHDILKGSVEAQTGRTSLLIIGILLGGVLVVCSYVADWAFADQAVTVAGKTYNFHSDSLALLGALLLGIPIILHAASALLHGETQHGRTGGPGGDRGHRGHRLQGRRGGGVLPAAGQPHRDPHRPGRAGEHRGPDAPLAQEGPPPDRPTGARSWWTPRRCAPATSSASGRGTTSPPTAWSPAGQSTVNQANVTGESLPVDKAVGRRGVLRHQQPGRGDRRARSPAPATTPRWARSASSSSRPRARASRSCG